MTERSPYTLDAVQLAKAEQALQKAAETLRPSPIEERLYRVLGTFVRVAVAAFVGMIAVAIIDASTDSRSRALDSLLRFFYLLFVGAALGAPVFLLLNQSVVRRTFRQRRLLEKLGIREISLSAWRVQRRGYRWSRLARAVLTLSGILTLVLGALNLIGYLRIMWTRGALDPSLRAEIPRGFLISGLLIALGATILVRRFVQRSREQWAIVADANRLRSALESMQTKAGAGEAVTVPAAVLEDVARIERVQIAREQRDAVVASAGATNRGYGVFVARDLSPQKGLLDPQQRVAVEDLIDNLSANPHPAGVDSTAEGLLSVRTPEGDVELQYSVDEGARRVHILTLTTHHNG